MDENPGAVGTYILLFCMWHCNWHWVESFLCTYLRNGGELNRIKVVVSLSFLRTIPWILSVRSSSTVSLKQIIARLLKTVKSALITFFFLFPKPISVRFSQRSLSIGSGRGCGGRQWRIGRKWRADRSQLAGQRTVEALRSRLLQGLQVLSGGEVALGTIDGHWPVLPDWIKYTFLPPNSLFNRINETWLGQGHGITNKTEQQYM